LAVEQKRLECFGTATTQDCCLQCPDNDECVAKTMEQNKMSVEEKIREKAQSATNVHDYTVIVFDKIRSASDEHKARKEWLEVCDKKEWVKLDDVLAIVNTAAGELAELLDNRPFVDERTKLGQSVMVKWVKKLERKVAELTQEAKP